MICVTLFQRNVQKRETKSDTSGHCLEEKANKEAEEKARVGAGVGYAQQYPLQKTT